MIFYPYPPRLYMLLVIGDRNETIDFILFNVYMDTGTGGMQ